MSEKELNDDIRLQDARAERHVIDMCCANCGHSPESHHAGTGQCYSCDSARRCCKWQPKTVEAAAANR
jgi:hypothetical protein